MDNLHKLELDEYGRVIIADSELLAAIAGATVKSKSKQEHDINCTNATCDHVWACHDLNCGN